jgi:tRNA (guanine-N7-)-methyltransferase
LRHHKHRIIQPEFLSHAARRAANDSRLCFRTDSEPYFSHAYRVLGAHPAWQLSPEEWPFEFCTVFQSRARSFRSLIARRASDSSHS